MAVSSTSDLVQIAQRNQVTTLTMNNPRKLNGWTLEMMAALRDAFGRAAADDETRVVILTGTDPYYSAGVNLSGSMGFGHPKTLRAGIIEHNEALFNLFIDYPKPLIAAVNGPAIGASVTSATLCDALVASDKATFSTPFARLGVPAEGCSSEQFPKLFGEPTAQRILGDEGWRPTGTEAAEIGLATQVVPHDELLDAAQALAEQWIAEGRDTRSFPGGTTAEQLRRINAVESVRVADAFLSTPFLRGQYKFLWSKKKRVPAAMFFGLRVTRPLWSRLL